MRKPKASWETVESDYKKAETEYNTAKANQSTDEKTLNDRARNFYSQKPLYDAMVKVQTARTELTTAEKNNETAQAGTDDIAKATATRALNQAKDNLGNLEDAAAYAELVGSLRGQQETELRIALKNIYDAEAEIQAALDPKDDEKEKTARLKLENAKEKWQAANQALQIVGTKDSVKSLEGDGIKTMKIAIKGHLKSLDGDISTLQSQLDSTGAGLANAPNAIIGVAEDRDKSLIRANNDVAAQGSTATAAGGEESADVWTKVAFTVSNQKDTSSTKESSISGSTNLEVGNWWASVKASSSFSSSSKKVESAMSKCEVSGSFSAMVVNIKRPWLHSDLFQDFDIDIPANTKLSPGAAQIKEWVEKGDPGTGANKRTEYGKFPAYPTAFIVAADTVLEVLCFACHD